MAAVFASAPEAVAAAFEVQCELEAAQVGESALLRARMGLHTDEGRLRAPVRGPHAPSARGVVRHHESGYVLSENNSAKFFE